MIMAQSQGAIRAEKKDLIGEFSYATSALLGGAYSKVLPATIVLGVTGALASVGLGLWGGYMLWGRSKPLIQDS